MRLHYIDRGEGTPVVLLHGNTVLLQDFVGSGLVDRLARHHRVIAFDRPGFGYSERPRDRLWTAQAQAALIEQALTQIGVERPVVLGHSWGTLVALGMATEFPAEVRGLVLISGYYYPTARLDVALTAPAAVPLLGDVMRYTVSPLTGRLLMKRTVEAMFAPRHMSADFFDIMPREMILRPLQIRAEAEDAAFMIPAAAHFRAEYAKLEMPVAIFAGAGDKIVDPKSHSTRLHRELPDSTLVIAPDAGHMAHYALADEVVDAVDRMSAKDGARATERNHVNRDAFSDRARLDAVPTAL
ncbi:alpha/beta fold hydrolase [Caballeronia humi]|uniref:alpha/beta fold hydrolase n=1 Tax=Caballeronia humi TaxID=326474 RepID=UPI001F37B3ED|nr:alpha/beta hydrolase [Caballeronia humi]